MDWLIQYIYFVLVVKNTWYNIYTLVSDKPDFQISDLAFPGCDLEQNILLNLRFLILKRI